MSLKSVSVIIPTLNEEKLIGQIIDRFNRKVKDSFDIEIIVSDGGSKDKTLDIAEGKVDKIVVHKEKYRQNISGGRNMGAGVSKGDVLFFFNADTYVKDPVGFISEALKSLEDEKVVAVACPVKVFEREEKLIDKIFHFSYNNYVKTLNAFFMGMGRGECHIIKRDFFLKVGGYDDKLFAGEDFDLYKRLREHGKIVYNRNLMVYESPRRYRKFGYTKVFWDWAKNSIWITVFKRSVSQVWEEIR